MVNITKETNENNDIEMITDKFGEIWLNERHVEQQLGLKNLPALTNKCDEKYKNSRYELIDDPIKQSCRRFIHNDLALKIIIDCRANKSCNLKRNLGFTLKGVINTKKQTVINSIKDAFEGEDMQTQYTILGYRIDLYFYKYKLAIEVDELGHNDRYIDYEIQRSKALERELDRVFIRINPDAADFSIFKEIKKIHRHINKLTKQQTKDSIIDNLSQRLQEIVFVKIYSIKSKCLKWIVKQILPAL